MRSWAWKREHRPDKARFKLPYKHTLLIEGDTHPVSLTIQQRRFEEEGFASTVWDSSIVVAKYFEKHQEEVKGRRCLDLSAGTGLVGIVLAKVSAEVVATDLGPNLGLLRENCSLNGEPGISVVEYEWGSQPLQGAPFDVISACDLMYIQEAIPQLVDTLLAVSDFDTKIILAHGRNRQAETVFFQLVDKLFTVTRLAGTELDERYQCIDVDVYLLQKLRI